MLTYALLGVGAGAVYALLGQGIVMIYRGSGILNLAHGALAMLAAYVFGTLRAQDGWATVPAALAGIAFAAIIGLATDAVLLRRLRTASALSRLIATLGVLLIIYASAVLKWGITAPIVLPIFASSPVTVFGATVNESTFWTLGAAIVLTTVLTLVWHYTRAGWLTEAVAENERAAAALGWSPRLVSSGTWTAGAALAGLAGVLIAPISQLNQDNLTLMVVPGLAAALIGGFRSFPLTMAGGLALGIVQSLTSQYVHITGASNALPFLLIIAVLIMRGSALPQRGHIFDRLPAIGSGQVPVPAVVAVTVAGGLVIFLVGSGDWLAAIAGTFAVGTILLSLVVVIGYTGQLSLAQYALAGLGGLFAAQLVAAAHWNFVLACVAGVLGSSAVGVVFALPALRTRGANLAVVTLGLGLATQAVIFDNPNYTGALSGVDVGSPSLLGWGIGAIDHPDRYAFVCFILFVIAALAVANLRRGRSGRRLVAVRSNERAAASLGISVWTAKIYAFALGGALAGLGGIMLAFSASTATFAAYSPFNSISAVADAVIGGIGYVCGAVTGATLAGQSIGSVVAIKLSQVDLYLPLIGGVGVLLTLLAAPNGNVHQMVEQLGKVRAKLPIRRPPAVDVDTAADPARVPAKRLVVEAMSVTYGRVAAVANLSVSVEPGEVVGLIGPNGAGKTSFMDAVTGFAECSGRVQVGDTEVSRWSPARRRRAGMARSFQALELFDDLTVLENLQAASEPQDLRSVFTDLIAPGRASLGATAVAALREFGLEDCLHKRPDELSFGQRRLVSLARACAGAPSVLLLDEPVAGLDDDQSAECARLVRRLADTWGMAILVIEHDMNFVMGVCDRLVVVDFGREIAAGTAADVRANPAALAAYLGEADDAPDPSGSDDAAPRRVSDPASSPVDAR